MAARPSHTKTVRLIVKEGMDINAIEIVRSLPHFKVEITAIVPNFRGKCFDITLHSTDTATCLATSGFDYGAERKPLKLLGARTIHVSVFVAVEYPDQDCKFSKAVWTVKVRKSMPPLSYRGGFTSIESGIGVAEFTSLDRDLPRKVVTQGLKIFCKYTRQLITCYRCGSTEHVIKNCPKQPSRFNHIHAEDHVLSAPPNPPNSQEMQEIQMETTGAEDSDDEISESVSSETLSLTPDLYSGAVSRDLFAEPNDPHFPQLNLETQRLKKSLRQSKIQTKINHNLREYRWPSNFFRRPLNKLMFGVNNILDRVNSPGLTLIFLSLVALINSISPDQFSSFSCSLSSYRLMAELLGPRYCLDVI